jgi:hypothetical protein
MVGNRVGAEPTQRCRTVESMRDVVNGYDVVYRYNGRDVNVVLPYNPGNTIKVRVGIIVDERAPTRVVMAIATRSRPVPLMPMPRMITPTVTTAAAAE